MSGPISVWSYEQASGFRECHRGYICFIKWTVLQVGQEKFTCSFAKSVQVSDDWLFMPRYKNKKLNLINLQNSMSGPISVWSYEQVAASHKVRQLNFCENRGLFQRRVQVYPWRNSALLQIDGSHANQKIGTTENPSRAIFSINLWQGAVLKPVNFLDLWNVQLSHVSVGNLNIEIFTLSGHTERTAHFWIQTQKSFLQDISPEAAVQNPTAAKKGSEHNTVGATKSKHEHEKSYQDTWDIGRNLQQYFQRLVTILQGDRQKVCEKKVWYGCCQHSPQK